MGRAAEFADEMERAWGGDAEGEAYHGPASRRLLDGVDAGAASRRPVATAHSIAELAEHLAVWNVWVAARVAGDRPPSPALDGWVRIDTLTDAEWNGALARLDASHAHLVAAVRGLDDATFTACRDSLRFALHHGLYHGGQIGVLRKA